MSVFSYMAASLEALARTVAYASAEEEGGENVSTENARGDES